MKLFAIISAISIATTFAFTAQTSQARYGTALSAEGEKTPLFKLVSGMDLFAPNPNINTYGARKSKNVRYMPHGCDEPHSILAMLERNVSQRVLQVYVSIF